MANDVPLPNEERIGNYRVVRTLLRGQSCDVLEVVQDGSGKRFALKQLREASAENALERRDFAFEAKLGMDFDHPNLIRVHEYVRSFPPYFVMDYFPSQHLRQLIAQVDRSPIPTPRLRRIIDQSARAISYMHERGWVHRDVKPENILVNKVGETRVIDYALALKVRTGFGRLLSSKPPCQGTASYMSPEQIQRFPPAVSCDIYSFGVTCYELVTGRQPFRANSQSELLQKHLRERPASPINYNKTITPEFADLILSMIQKDPRKRPGSLQDFLLRFRKTRILTTDEDPLASPSF